MVPALPADQHAHVAGAANALDFDSFIFEERRDFATFSKDFS